MLYIFCSCYRTMTQRLSIHYSELQWVALCQGLGKNIQTCEGLCFYLSVLLKKISLLSVLLINTLLGLVKYDTAFCKSQSYLLYPHQSKLGSSMSLEEGIYGNKKGPGKRTRTPVCMCFLCTFSLHVHGPIVWQQCSRGRLSVVKDGEK